MKFKIIDGNYKKDGLRIYDDTCPTLNQRDYKEPKMVMYMNQKIKMEAGIIVAAQRGRGEEKTAQQLEPKLFR